MKKYLIGLLIASALVSSCGTSVPKGYIVIDDYHRKMEIMMDQYQEIYWLFCSGQVKDVVISYSMTENKYHISYKYR